MAGQPDPELTARLRALPAVHLLVNAPSARELEAAHGHLAVTEAARAAELLDGLPPSQGKQTLLELCAFAVDRTS